MDADQILVFHHGRIVQRGKHSELVAQTGFYQQIYEAQTRLEERFEAEVGALSN
jgi:ATP-binding cassette subfamily B protein